MCCIVKVLIIFINTVLLMRSQLTFAGSEMGEDCGKMSEWAGERARLGRVGEHEKDRLIRFAAGS